MFTRQEREDLGHFLACTATVCRHHQDLGTERSGMLKFWALSGHSLGTLLAFAWPDSGAWSGVIVRGGGECSCGGQRRIYNIYGVLRDLLSDC